MITSTLSALRFIGKKIINFLSLAARYFLNALDRVENLKEKYQKNVIELKNNIQMMEQIAIKPFVKSNELSQLKLDVAKLEREISIRIQTNQMKQHEGELNPSVEKGEAVVVELNTHQNSDSIKNENDKAFTKKNELAPKK